MDYEELVASGASVKERRVWLAGGTAHTTTVRLPDRLREAAEREAASEGISLAAYVRRALLDSVAGKPRR